MSRARAQRCKSSAALAVSALPVSWRSPFINTSPEHAETGDDAKPQVEADSSQSSDPLAVPPQFDPVFTEYAPGKKTIALVGSRTRDDGSRQYGLFTYNVANNQITCLIEKGLKTRPAWSPDSTKIAIGNSPGYGNIYPLVIVDVETGKIDETGVQGAGAAWSPDGRYVAVSTGFGNAGSLSAGVPCDGRIGVCVTIPESAVSMSGREASDVIGELLERHQLWIRSSQDPLPTTSYTFRVEDRETKIELPSKKPSFARGLTLTLGLDHVHFAPVMQALAPHRAELASILSARNGDSDEAIAIACRLAGYSQIRELVEPLQALLKHESSSVQDAAVIGLALLGKKDSARLDQLAEKSKSTNSDHPLESKLATEIGWAIR